jgi:hypothetical protein
VKKPAGPDPIAERLFYEAGFDDEQAKAKGVDPVTSASVLAKSHLANVPGIVARALAIARGGESAMRGVGRLLPHLPDKGLRLLDHAVNLQPPSEERILRATKLYAKTTAPEALERLQKLLKHPAAPIRLAALEGLSAVLPVEQFGPIAAQVVTEEEKPEPKITVLEALAESKAIGASAVAARVIHDGDADVRKAASRALQRMGYGAVMGILADVRERGQPAVGLIVDSVRAILGGDPKNLPPDVLEKVTILLREGLKDKEHQFVRMAAAMALGEHGATQDDYQAVHEACTFEKDELTKAQMECARETLKKRVNAT